MRFWPCPLVRLTRLKRQHPNRVYCNSLVSGALNFSWFYILYQGHRCLGFGLLDWRGFQGKTHLPRHLHHQPNVTHIVMDRTPQIIWNSLTQSQRNRNHQVTYPHQKNAQTIIPPQHPRNRPRSHEQMPRIRPRKKNQNLRHPQTPLP